MPHATSANDALRVVVHPRICPDCGSRQRHRVRRRDRRRHHRDRADLPHLRHRLAARLRHRLAAPVRSPISPATPHGGS